MAGFWGDGTQDGPDPDATTPPEGFATGGLIGFLSALGAPEDETDDGLVDDPEALRRAEEAVAHDPVERPAGAHIDEAWTTVATQVRPDDNAGLQDVASSLESEGIDFGWDPYDPRDRPGFTISDMVQVARKPYSIVVPESQSARAREALSGTPAQGVTYAWPTGPAPRPAPDAIPGDDTGSGSATSAPSAVTRYGPLVSDNERLERMASGGLPAGTIALAAIAALVAIGAVAFLLLR